MEKVPADPQQPRPVPGTATESAAPEAAPAAPRADRGVVLPLFLTLASLAVLWGVTHFVVSPQVERWIECRGSHPLPASLLLVLHQAIGTPGFFAVWAIGLLVLCSQVGGRLFRLTMTVNLMLCGLAAAQGLAALYLLAQRCGG